MRDTKNDPCHECGEPIGETGTLIVTTVQVEGGVAIVGHALCERHKDDKLARDKAVWAIQRMTGK